MNIDSWLMEARAGAAAASTASRTRETATPVRTAASAYGGRDLHEPGRLPRPLRGDAQVEAVRLPRQLDGGAQRRLGLEQLGLAPAALDIAQANRVRRGVARPVARRRRLVAHIEREPPRRAGA